MIQSISNICPLFIMPFVSRVTFCSKPEEACMWCNTIYRLRNDGSSVLGVMEDCVDMQARNEGKLHLRY